MTVVTALYAGVLRPLAPEDQRTGIFKSPRPNAKITDNGISGDEHADRRDHGGPEKALHQYAIDSYDKIMSAYPELKGVAVPGSIGENISATDMNDANVCIGDCYQIGAAIVQVSQPRSPCWKIDRRFGVERLSAYVEKQCITGWYYRVIETGTVHVRDSIELLDRPNENVPVAYFMRVITEHRPDSLTLDELIACRGLAEEWKTRLKNRRKYLRTAV